MLLLLCTTRGHITNAWWHLTLNAYILSLCSLSVLLSSVTFMLNKIIYSFSLVNAEIAVFQVLMTFPVIMSMMIMMMMMNELHFSRMLAITVHRKSLGVGNPSASATLCIVSPFPVPSIDTFIFSGFSSGWPLVWKFWKTQKKNPHGNTVRNVVGKCHKMY